ncbi:MAG TPA: DHA2 family efflux MFS transporter permease subunit [Candidatus Binatia bacterium]|nr:DHA2 family efflux MFS transporter permease subunit [Candidatus Binatia bacterium]
MVSVTENQASDSVTPAVWIGFAMLCIGMFMAILDVQVVATSLPTIQEALDIAKDQMSWIQTAYLIAEIISIPLTGFLTRLLTMRWLFVIAVSFFTLASIACAASSGFSSLITFRVLQGFSGGTLIPVVFSAVFLLFPLRLQPLATTIAGVLAVLAPTVGPVVGGWITETYSWHWLFLINVVPGIVAAVAASVTLPRGRASLAQFRHLDVVSLGLGAIALAALEIAIKEAPERGWASPLAAGLLGLCLLTASGFIIRTLLAPNPLVNLRTFRDRNFSIGCLLSFVLGSGLFGSIYLMPVFLAYVRGHNAFEIGKIMLVTGIAQLIVAPIAVFLVRRFDVRLLTALGFVVFGIGLGMSAFQTKATDFDEMFWPQLVRGCAIMFCILPPTQLALGQLAKSAVDDASGLFNLMRNLGGAIGIALIDTVIFTRAPEHARTLVNRLMAGDLDAAKALGIPAEMLGSTSLDPEKQAILASLVDKVAFVDAVNEAWALVALMALAALIVVPFARRAPGPGAKVT